MCHLPWLLAEAAGLAKLHAYFHIHDNRSAPLPLFLANVATGACQLPTVTKVSHCLFDNELDRRQLSIAIGTFLSSIVHALFPRDSLAATSPSHRTPNTRIISPVSYELQSPIL
ncbi:hypothetical protein CC80DRAFT_551621 [Byssothecium circinans]|uniref:Uncharacterized protein n=1 Tax=Byssothecium circinans TaxID=147558 RepID=A0A6A5TNC8_9PLEO|nr:hypothetical protein CC80DRAFT_551621 [Byssothecium circinans]